MKDCPVCKESTLRIKKLYCCECDITLEGDFELPRYMRMSNEHKKLAELFLLSGGNLKDLAEKIGVSYPTLRKQVDEMIENLRKEKEADDLRIENILDDIETGKITAQKGMRKIKEINGGY